MKENKIKVSLKEITRKYENGDGIENINLDVYEGELLTLLGPSGCGKTTLLRTIGGFLKLDSGKIVLDNEDVSKLPPEKRPTAMVFQSYNLWPHMTIFDNLAFGLKIRKINKSLIEDEIKKILKLVKMEGIEKKYPSQLSGGQQQRVAIARALLLKPSLLLLDEPFSALDARIRAQMREELKKIQTTLGITVVFVTHDQEEAMTLSDRIVVMNKGKFEQIGTPGEIYDKPKSKFVAGFIGNMNFFEKGSAVIAVRPENILLKKEAQSEYTGSIENVMILGHYAEVNVKTEVGTVKSYISREEASNYKIAETVSILFEKYHSYSS